MGADPAQKALGKDTDHGGRYQKRGNIHIQKTDQPSDGVLGVEGCQDLVAGERCLHGHVGGKTVPDLSDHYDVRVLADDMAQGFLKG